MNHCPRRLCKFKWILFAIAVSGLAAAADTPSQRPNGLLATDVVGQVAQLHASPYTVASRIRGNSGTSLRSLWRQLGIEKPSVDSGNAAANSRMDDALLADCRNCRVDTYELELDGAPGREVVVRVADRLSEACRYLVFARQRGTGVTSQWRLVGHIDHGFGRYQMPQHRALVIGGRHWLVIKMQTGAGSGFARYEDRVFHIVDFELREIVRFPSQGLLSPCCGRPTRSFYATIERAKRHGDTAFIDVVFQSRYATGAGKDGLALWQKRQRARYMGDIATGRFFLDASRSTITMEEIDALLAADELDDKRLLEFNRSEIAHIARTSVGKRQAWVNAFVGRFQPLPDDLPMDRGEDGETTSR